ncbi:MAG: UDP-glucose 4-epimerase [Hyphomicrobiales bacterium]|nr:UDP-glucose 4-epimerase [Hyphomicrobiales bacterium]
MAKTRFFISGGAGFLGSNLVNTILDRGLGPVTVFDNFLTGRREHFGERVSSPDLSIVAGDASDLRALTNAVGGHDTVVHLAANSDIAKAASEPLIDFDNGTRLTQTLLEAMRATGVKRILFTSGSGVYGEVPPKPIPEDYAPLIPISTYGASKLASETLVSAYSHMFDIVGTVFRFANVVGPHMTHGVSHDFTRRLHADASRLQILGDGMQSKPYIHSDDVVAAILFILQKQTSDYAYYNVGSEDHLLVRDIADIVTGEMGLKNVKYEYTGGTRGWRADVPVYRLDTSKIRALGWSNKMNSREAVVAAVRSLLGEIAAGL